METLLRVILKKDVLAKLESRMIALEIYMKGVFIRVEKDMDMESKFIQMEVFMKGDGMITDVKDKVSLQ